MAGWAPGFWSSTTTTRSSTTSSSTSASWVPTRRSTATMQSPSTRLRPWSPTQYSSARDPVDPRTPACPRRSSAGPPAGSPCWASASATRPSVRHGAAKWSGLRRSCTARHPGSTTRAPGCSLDSPPPWRPPATTRWSWTVSQSPTSWRSRRPAKTASSWGSVIGIWTSRVCSSTPSRS